MKPTRFVVVAMTMLYSSVPVLAQYFPQTGPAAIHQRALDAKARLNVLSISLQPGYEDLAALAYFRMGDGARIVSAYVTNGEAGESDVRGEYPNFLAATRRSEAASAMALLGGEEYFLNMPDFGAATDTAVVKSQWIADTLQMRLDKLLSDLRPDVILIPGDWATRGESPKQTYLINLLIRSLKRLEPTREQIKAGGADEMFRWSVDRILLQSGSTKGMRIPVDRPHPFWKKTYAAIGDEAGNAYVSLKVQRKQWYGTAASRPLISYEHIYPLPARGLKAVDDGLPRPAPSLIRKTDREIADLARLVEHGALTASVRSEALRRVSAVIDMVDGHLTRPMELTSQSRKICMQWKLTLESLRTTLLGIFVRYKLDPLTLTERQVTLLSIDSIAGTQVGDSIWVYFPFAGDWFVDEATTKLVSLRLKTYYRLLSPAALDHDLPAAGVGLNQPTIGKVLTFFIMGKSNTRDHNFIYRCSPRVLYSERFSTEVLTPMVRAVPNERIMVRTTNHSRDGVRDSVQVNDTLAVSDKKEFRINVKDYSDIDTLTLQWKRQLAEGTYLLPVNISVKPVSRFAARKFDVRTGASKRITLITGIDASPTGETLRRLGLQYMEVKDVRFMAGGLQGSQIAIVDRRAMSLMVDFATQRQTLRQFVESGGHLIILAQDAVVWNAAPLVEGLELEPTDALEEGFEVEFDEHNRIITAPNLLTWQDWEDWLFRRAHNMVSGPALNTAIVSLKSKLEKNPLIAEWSFGSGTLTYVDLALQQQFLNIHPGAFRLLANLISY